LRLEEALQGHEEKVDSLLKAAGKYLSALKGWKKACQQGHLCVAVLGDFASLRETKPQLITPPISPEAPPERQSPWSPASG
jgi:hypothetical protein